MMAMSYVVYVATVGMGANMNQLMKALMRQSDTMVHLW